MNSKNKVIYSQQSLELINDTLAKIASDPMISFNVNDESLSEDIKIDRCSFTLDDGAVEILKAYYKSKVEAAKLIKDESKKIVDEITKKAREAYKRM